MGQLKVSLDHIIPLTEARDHFSRIVAEVQKDKLYVLTKGGKPAVAIIDVKYLEAISRGAVNIGHVEEEILKDPAKVGRPIMVEHTNNSQESDVKDQEAEKKEEIKPEVKPFKPWERSSQPQNNTPRPSFSQVKPWEKKEESSSPKPWEKPWEKKAETPAVKTEEIPQKPAPSLVPNQMVKPEEQAKTEESVATAFSAPSLPKPETKPEEPVKVEPARPLSTEPAKPATSISMPTPDLPKPQIANTPPAQPVQPTSQNENKPELNVNDLAKPAVLEMPKSLDTATETAQPVTEAPKPVVQNNPSPSIPPVNPMPIKSDIVTPEPKKDDVIEINSPLDQIKTPQVPATPTIKSEVNSDLAAIGTPAPKPVFDTNSPLPTNPPVNSFSSSIPSPLAPSAASVPTPSIPVQTPTAPLPAPTMPSIPSPTAPAGNIAPFSGSKPAGQQIPVNPSPFYSSNKPGSDSLDDIALD